MTEHDEGPGEWWDRLQPDEPEQLKRDRPLPALLALVVGVAGAGAVAAVSLYLVAFELIPWLFEVFLGPVDAEPVVPAPSTLGP